LVGHSHVENPAEMFSVGRRTDCFYDTILYCRSRIVNWPGILDRKTLKLCLVLGARTACCFANVGVKLRWIGPPVCQGVTSDKGVCYLCVQVTIPQLIYEYVSCFVVGGGCNSVLYGLKQMMSDCELSVDGLDDG